ncbi:hypothetical protein P389DRAFT_194198 [Cystobasidium minutum MCA 4210]|uniref:uncharacterized protein n=1 Tax=Cystobasidium minutum MCA 4210 TaxID=1397322 RepID=UPI0034CE6A5A|eukprot:jgi/Rhomi1/194198/gm1.2412_g
MQGGDRLVQELVKRLPEGQHLIAGYIPRNDLTAIAVALYSIVTILLWTNWYRHGKHRWMLALTCGATCMTIGFFVRIGCHYKPYDLGIYIVSTLFILLSPCAFLAANYVCLSHIARYLGNDVTTDCLILPATIIVKFFVISDITTFLIQAAGGAMTASGQENPSMGEVGRKVSMAGLSLQLASFATYTVILLYFGYRVRKLFPKKWSRGSTVAESDKQAFAWYKVADTTPIAEWRILYFTVCATCIGFLIRSGFRVSEFKDGYSGYLYTHEGYFYGLDALPLLISISAYIFVWPPRFLKRSDLFRDLDRVEEVETQEAKTAKEASKTPSVEMA